MRMKRFIQISPLIVVVFGCWFLTDGLFGVQGTVRRILVTLVCCSLAAGLLLLVRRLRPGVWLIAGLIGLGASFLPLPMLVEHPDSLPQQVEAVWQMVLFFVPLTTPIVGALLATAALNLYQDWRRAGTTTDTASQARPKPAAWLVAGAFLLSGLVLARILHDFYWLIVWDSAGDSLDFLWLIFLAPAVLFAGGLISFALQGRLKWTGPLYALLVMGAFLAVYTAADRVDFRQLTEAHAVRVSRAIEAYHAREGHYPQDLQQLIPRYALWLPGPVILYGQGWCYDGGSDYYRLGYVYRQHWSDPRLSGRTYKAVGALPNLPGICAGEIAALRQRNPGYFTTLNNE
jgi:hypothetical protein